METGYVIIIIIISRAFRKYKAKRNAGRSCAVSAWNYMSWKRMNRCPRQRCVQL